MKKIVLAVVIVAVVIVGGFMVLGLVTPVETLVAAVAEEQNESRGRMADPITRYDGSVADGASLVVQYTMLDGWHEALVDKLESDLGRTVDRDELMSILAAGHLENACEMRTEVLGKPEARVLFEYRDERGEPVIAVEARTSTC